VQACAFTSREVEERQHKQGNGDSEAIIRAIAELGADLIAGFGRKAAAAA
jgi:hypothetical protein